MKIEVLISSMFVDNIDDASKYCHGYSLLINQTDFSRFPKLLDITSKNRIISVEQKGLSKSRNMAIENSVGDICVLADNDGYFLKDYVETISVAYKQFPDAGIIIFDYIESIDGKEMQNSLYSKAKRLNRITAMKSCSIRITFKRELINQMKIRFNESFGAGTIDFPSGEENIFLNDCFNAGIKIYYVPQPILTLKSNDSTWFKGFNERYFNTIGACAYKLWGKFWFLYILQFIFRHYFLFNREMDIIKAFRYATEGKKVFLNKISKGHGVS